MATTIGVLALQGAVAEHVRVLEALGAQAREVRRVEDLADVSGLVIPGGESTAMARLAAGSGLFPTIRRRIEAGTLAVLGTCAGLILLSDRVEPEGSLPSTIGGLAITVTRNGYGGQLASFEATLMIGGQPFRAAFIRAPRITAVAPNVRVLASHQGEAVVVESKKLVAATCHPELTGETALHERLLQLAS